MLSSCTHLHRYRSHSIQVSLPHYCYVLSPPLAIHYVEGCAPPHIAKRWPLTSRRVYVLGKGSGGGSSTRTARPPCALRAHLPPLPVVIISIIASTDCHCVLYLLPSLASLPLLLEPPSARRPPWPPVFSARSSPGSGSASLAAAVFAVVPGRRGGQTMSLPLQQ